MQPTIDKYISQLLANGAFTAVPIAPQAIVTASWTIMKCRYGCNRYGHNRSCPPFAPDYKETREILDCYRRAILFGVRTMAEGTPLAIECLRSMTADGLYKAIAFGTGPCTLCSDCKPGDCPRPHETAPSMEACGIDVVATVRNAGLSINTPPRKDSPLSCYGLILVD